MQFTPWKRKLKNKIIAQRREFSQLTELRKKDLKIKSNIRIISGKI